MDWKNFKEQFSEHTQFQRIGNNGLMETAFHEAGHALIHVLHGFIPKQASIISERDSLGHVISQFNDFHQYTEFLMEQATENDDWWSDTQICEFRILSLLAGTIAGACYTGRYNWKGGVSDFNQVIDMFLSMGILDITTDISQTYWDRTTELIIENKDLLIKIAHDLYERKTLDESYFELI